LNQFGISVERLGAISYLPANEAAREKLFMFGTQGDIAFDAVTFGDDLL
jgi:hypothetical protein